VNVGEWLLWGFAATVVLTALMAGTQALNLTRMNIPYLLGTMVTADRDRARIYGILLHLANGWIFALVYLAMFHSIRHATPLLGALIGVVHGFFVLAVGLPALPALHPRMARRLEPPGFLGRHYGVRTPISVLVAHAVFGAILGGFYRLG
jgi:hypothetical protein